MKNFPQKRQRGLSMIEILITILIVAIGFLGVASMQMLNLKTVNNTQYRSMATLHAYDMAERMRSNVASVKAGLYEISDADASSTTATCSACNAVQMAAVDADQWKTQIRNKDTAAITDLPRGKGKVEQVPGTSFYDITVSWQESSYDTDDKVATGGTAITNGKLGVKNEEFVLRVRI